MAKHAVLTNLSSGTVENLEDLLKSFPPNTIRKALVQFYFEVTINMKDMPLDFQMHSLVIYELIKFFESVEEEGNSKITE